MTCLSDRPLLTCTRRHVSRATRFDNYRRVRPTAMTRDGFGAYRLWGRKDDEHTPLISRGGRVSQALQLGNLQRVVVTMCGLAGLVALACVYLPAWGDSEVESKISSVLGKQGGISPTQSPTQCSLSCLVGLAYYMERLFFKCVFSYRANPWNQNFMSQTHGRVPSTLSSRA